MSGKVKTDAAFDYIAMGKGGDITVEQVGSAVGGSLTVAAGQSTSGNNTGGALALAGGQGFGSAAGGACTLQSGASDTASGTGTGGATTVQGGTGGTTSGVGGSVTVKGGIAGVSTGNCGLVTIESGDDSSEQKEDTVYGRIDVHAVDASAEYPLGTQLVYGTRTYRYAKANGAIAKGSVVQSAVVSDTPANQTSIASIDVVAAAAGTTTIVTANATCLVNDFAGGYLVIEQTATADAEGGAYLIKSNTVATGGAGTTITLYEAITEAVDNDTEVHVVKNLYSDVIIAPTELTGILVGVTPCVVADTEFFWLQTSGLGGVLTKDVSGHAGEAAFVAAKWSLNGTAANGTHYPSRIGDRCFICNGGGFAHGGQVTGYVTPALDDDANANSGSGAQYLAGAGQCNVFVGNTLGLATSDASASAVVISGFMP